MKFIFLIENNEKEVEDCTICRDLDTANDLMNDWLSNNGLSFKDTDDEDEVCTDIFDDQEFISKFYHPDAGMARIIICENEY